MSPPRGCQGCARHSVLDTGRADDLHERHLTTWTGRAPWVDTGFIDELRADPGAVQGWPNEDPELIAVLLLYAVTMFVGATLLFVVQPMVGKMILPLLGGLLLLSLSVGLPFLVVSATAPLLQKWFSHTGHAAASDPYFLYAASNLGSMLALLGYPTLIEPRLHLRGEGWLTQT